MTATVTIPIIDYSISINSLIAIVLLLCIFFTFFSLSITFVGLGPAATQNNKRTCSHSDHNQANAQLSQTTREQLRALRSSITQEL